MTEHVLMTYAVRKPYGRTGVVPEDAEYDATKGYWVKAGIPLVNSREFTEAGWLTKKHDQETGEDQKGE